MRLDLLNLAMTSRWAMRRDAIPSILAAIRSDAPDQALTPQTAAPATATSARLGGNVAVIPIRGVITHRSSWWKRELGWGSIEDLRTMFRHAISDEAIGAIVLDVDSPGGTVDGVPEMADEIFAARGQKPIIAVSNTLMCSAAYWLASQADKIVASPSADTGSIGVYTMHEDISEWLKQLGSTISLIFAGEHKVDGHPFAPLPDEVRAEIQSGVDEIYRDFLAAVGRGRGISAADVKAAYGDGRVFSAREAKKLGAADSIGTFDSAVQRVAGKRGRSALALDWEAPIVAEVAEPPSADPPNPDQAAIDRDQALLTEALLEASRA